MSLLMDALRKAEQAKKEVAGPAGTEQSSPVNHIDESKEARQSPAGLTLERSEESPRVSAVGMVDPDGGVEENVVATSWDAEDVQIVPEEALPDAEAVRAKPEQAEETEVLMALEEKALEMPSPPEIEDDTSILNTSDEAAVPVTQVTERVDDVRVASVAAPPSAQEEVVAEPEEPESPSLQAGIISAEASRQMARSVFVAKKEYQLRKRNRGLLILGLVALVLMVGGAGFFLYMCRLQQSSIGSAVVVQGKHAAPPVQRPVPSIPEAQTTAPEGENAPAPPSSPMVTSAASEGADPSKQGLPQVSVSVPESSRKGPAVQVADGGASSPAVSSPKDNLQPAANISGPSGKDPVAQVRGGGSPSMEPAPVQPVVAADSLTFSDNSGRKGAAVSKTSEPQKVSSSVPAAETQVFDEPTAIAPAPPSRPVIEISHRLVAPQADVLLVAAYAAYQQGDLVQARQKYEQVLHNDPRNKGALQGLAAIAVQGKEGKLARELFLRVLDQDPDNPLARAGLLAVAPEGEPARQESELKLLLEKYPQVAALFFSLGDVYAAGQRWNDAQQAYFNGLQVARKTAGKTGVLCPDYPFNLAVSLEHLGQTRAAMTYYQEALKFARGGAPAGFDVGALETRMKTLGEREAP